MFEAFALTLARALPVAEVARMLGVNAQPLWQRLCALVGTAYDRESFTDLRQIHIDETAMRRGHDYVTVVADSVKRRVVFATGGKDSLTLSDFASELRGHGASPEQISHATMDFSAAYILGVRTYLPNARISFDPFHLVALASQAVDEIRRAEVTQQPMLRKQRYSLLKDQTKLSARQQRFIDELSASHLKTARAWRIKECLRDIVRDKAPEADTRAALKKLTGWAQRSRLPAMVRLGRTIRKHFDGIVRAIAERRSNGFAEGLNSAIQAAKQRARGFKTTENFIAIIYLIAGKLSHLPTNPMATGTAAA